MPTCNICHSSLTNIKLLKRGSLRRTHDRPLGGGISTYEAWCSKCEILLMRKTFGKKDSGWQSSIVKDDELVSEVNKLQLFKLIQEVLVKDSQEKYSTAKERWDKFISMKKDSDKLFQYIRKDGPTIITGYVIKRENNLIGFYVHNINGLKRLRINRNKA